MKTFNVTTFPICGGIAVPISNTIRCKTEIQAIKQAAKKHLSFSISEVYFEHGIKKESVLKKYRNYDGVLELIK